MWKTSSLSSTLTTHRRQKTTFTELGGRVDRSAQGRPIRSSPCKTPSKQLTSSLSSKRPIKSSIPSWWRWRRCLVASAVEVCSDFTFVAIALKTWLSVIPSSHPNFPEAYLRIECLLVGRNRWRGGRGRGGGGGRSRSRSPRSRSRSRSRSPRRRDRSYSRDDRSGKWTCMTSQTAAQN